MKFRYSLEVLVAAPRLNVLASGEGQTRAPTEVANPACASEPVRAFARAFTSNLLFEPSHT
jgi:hypothetical protein